MKFKERECQFPGKKKLIKVDANNQPLADEEPILVRLIKDEGTIYSEGTTLSAENLNTGNWRDDTSISFTKLSNNILPNALSNQTQIVTMLDGTSWLIPPIGGTSKELGGGTTIKVNNITKNDLAFSSDPQTQLNNKVDKSTSITINGVTKALTQSVQFSITSSPNIKTYSSPYQERHILSSSGETIIGCYELESTGIVQAHGGLTSKILYIYVTFADHNKQNKFNMILDNKSTDSWQFSNSFTHNGSTIYFGLNGDNGFCIDVSDNDRDFYFYQATIVYIPN